MKKNFKAAHGAPIRDSDAKLIGTFLEKEFPDGHTPKEMVEAARPSRSPIHQYFEWDKSKGFEMYLLGRARCLVAWVAVSFEGEEAPIRAFHSVVIDDHRKYVSHEKAASDEPLWQQVVLDAKKQLYMWRDRYSLYKEFSEIIEGINNLEKKESKKTWQERRKNQSKKLKNKKNPSKSPSQGLPSRPLASL